MTEAQLAILQELAAEGYAVAVFTPEELDGVDPVTVEDHAIAAGWNAIELEKSAS